MRRFFGTLSPNKVLGLLLGILGLVAAFAGTPFGGTRVTIDTQELATIVQREVDHVAPEELADWIIAARADYRLIDLRSQREYAAYHIPTAENVQITGLGAHGLARNEKIVLYSEGGIHSAQAWFLLRAQGYAGVYILRGGLEEWRDRILFPRVPDNATPAQRIDFARAREVAAYFGGAAQGDTSSRSPVVAPALPRAAMPALPQSPPAGAPKKKKKEGC